MVARLRISPLWVAAILPLMTVATLGTWSHWRGMVLGRQGASYSVYARSEYGQLLLHFHRTDPGSAPRWLLATWPHEPAWASPHVAGWWRLLGFGYAVGGTAAGNAVRQVAIPYWLLGLLTLLPLALPRRLPPSTA